MEKVNLYEEEVLTNELPSLSNVEGENEKDISLYEHVKELIERKKIIEAKSKENENEIGRFVQTSKETYLYESNEKRIINQGSVIDVDLSKIYSKQDFLSKFKIVEGIFDNVEYLDGMPIESNPEDEIVHDIPKKNTF